MTSVSPLYETLIERDVEAIRAAVAGYRREHSSDELFLAVARFAILAYAPSQHAKHALLCCVAAHDLRDELGAAFDGAVTECAIYTAQSRQPWSEPPILDPPPVEANQRGDVDELREAVAGGDRLRGERWLAARLDTAGLARDLFTVAADDFEDLGHKLIVAVAAWKLAALLGEKGRFATIRTAIWEMTAYQGETYRERGTATGPGDLLEHLLAAVVAEEGSLLAAHALFLFDAALEASEIAGEPAIARRVFDHLGVEPRMSSRSAEWKHATDDVMVYRLARDYGECFKAQAVARRLRGRFPETDVDRLTAAARYNLEHAPSFEEWSFA